MAFLSKIGSLLVSTKIDDKGFQKGARRSAKQLSFMQKQSQAFSRSISSSFTTIGASFGAAFAVGSIVTDAARTISNFDQSVSNLASVSGKTRKEMNGLVDSAKQIGSVSAFSASEVVGLQTELAKLGFSEREILASTKAIGDFSIAVGTDAASAASLAGSALRSFGIDASESSRVVNTLAVATTKSALDFEKLNVALSIVGPVAKGANISIERSTALLGVLADRGLDASTAGTSLRNIFLDLSESGLSYEDALSQINNSTDKLNTANQLFGKRGATTALILAENQQAADSLEASITNVDGALQTMTDQRLDTLQGQLTLSKSAWESFVLSVDQGDGVISKAVKGVVSSFGEIFKELQILNESGINGLIANGADNIAAGRRRSITSQLNIAGVRGRSTNTLADQTNTDQTVLEGLKETLQGLQPETDQYRQTIEDIATVQARINERQSEYKSIVEGITKSVKAQTVAVKEQIQERSLLDSIDSLSTINQVRKERANPFALTRTGSENFTGNTLSSQSGKDRLAGINPKLAEVPDRITAALYGMKLAAEQSAASMAALGASIGNSLASGASSFAEYGRSILSTMTSIIGGYIKTYVAGILVNSLSFLGPFAALAAPAIGGLAAGAFNTAINSLVVPQLASGGVLSSSTLFLGGEYPGANRNKEIVTPERLMAKVMSSVLAANGNTQRLYSRISGGDILQSSERGSYDKSRLG